MSALRAVLSGSRSCSSDRFAGFGGCVHGPARMGFVRKADINQALRTHHGRHHELCYADRTAAYIKLAMQFQRALAFVAAMSMILGFSGCGSPEPKAVVSIQSTHPSGDAVLVGGDLVTFTVTVRAQGLSKPSTVALVIQADDQLLGVAEPVSIEEGESKILQAQVRVPQSSSVQIITPLYVGGAEQTSVVDVRRFKVVGKRERNG